MAAAWAVGAAVSAPGVLVAGEASWRLPLPAAQVESVVPQSGGTEILVVLRQPLPAAEMARLEALAAARQASLILGQDALLLRLPAAAEVRRERGGLVVTPRADARPDAEERRLRLLEAQGMARDGRLGAARQHLTEALLAAPEDAALLVALAEVEARNGAWRNGLLLYDRLLAGDPGAADLAAARLALEQRHGPQLQANAFGAFAAGGERVQASQIRMEFPLGEVWRVDAGSEFRHGSARRVQRADGQGSGPLDVSRALGEVGLARSWGEGASSRVAVLGSTVRPGLAGQHRIEGAGVATTFSADWLRPYWETLTVLRSNANRSAALAQQDWRLGRDFALQLRGGYLVYGVPSVRNMFAGPAAGLRLAWTVPPAASPLPPGWSMRLAYTMAGEYIARSGYQSGATRSLLDLRRRETHAVDATVEGRLGPGRASLTAGWVQDRFGGGGPVAVLRYGNGGAGALRFGLDLGLGPTLAVQPRTAYRAAAFLTWTPGLDL